MAKVGDPKGRLLAATRIINVRLIGGEQFCSRWQATAEREGRLLLVLKSGPKAPDISARERENGG